MSAASTLRMLWEVALPQGLRVQALCIGVDNYTKLDPLRNAISDAKGIAQRVTDLPNSRASVVCENPATKRALRDSIQQFLETEVSKVSPPRIIIIFFAGHGRQEGDMIFMIPAGADPKTFEELKKTCLSHDELFRLLKTGLDDIIQV